MSRAFLALALLLVPAASAEAQTSAPAPPSYFYPAADGSMAPGPLLMALPYEPTWSVDLLLGNPAGVRVQRSLGDGIGRDWLIEGFAGLDIIIFPMIGGGIRRRLTPFQGDHNAFVISPGVGVYVLGNTLHGSGVSLRGINGWLTGGPSTYELLALDVDILWLHDFNDRCGGQIGLRLGASPWFNEHGGVLPIVSIVFGLRF